MAGVLKQSTRLAGLAVVKYPHNQLLVTYNKCLRLLDTMPKESVYRQSTEAIIKERQEIVKQNPCIADIEEKIGCGQVEEILLHAHNELSLVQKMCTYKPWESLIHEAPENQWVWPPHK